MISQNRKEEGGLFPHINSKVLPLFFVMIVFKIDILKELKKKGYSQKYLISNKIFSKYTIQSFREIARQDSGSNHNLELNTLNKLCLLLRMDPGDIIGVVPAKEDGDLLLSLRNPQKKIPERQRRKKHRMTKMKSISLIELPTISAIFLLSNPLTSHFAEIITEKIPGATRRGLSMP